VSCCPGAGHDRQYHLDHLTRWIARTGVSRWPLILREPVARELLTWCRP